MFHKVLDDRVGCLSIMIEMAIEDYLKLVDSVYDSSGGIDGQRAKLKTKTALTVRNRMVTDLVSGAVIPPIVLGFLTTAQGMQSFISAEQYGEIARFMMWEDGKVSIIDGMQRTTALLDAVSREPAVAKRKIRVELWVAQNLNSLIYRMLVLNTGQVPWDIGRQLETIYGQFISQVQDALHGEIEVFRLEDNRRRSQASQYQSKSIIELMLIFSSRKNEVDIKERISEEFARIDVIEASSNASFIDYFIRTLRMLSSLDKAFSRMDVLFQPVEDDKRVRLGRDIFGSFPAMAGFCAAVSVFIFDEPGFDIEWKEVSNRIADAETAVDTLIQKIYDIEEFADFQAFMQFTLLEEKLSQRSTQVGRFERDFFRKAFTAVLRNSPRLNSMVPCWMAH